MTSQKRKPYCEILNPQQTLTQTKTKGSLWPKNHNLPKWKDPNGNYPRTKWENKSFSYGKQPGNSAQTQENVLFQRTTQNRGRWVLARERFFRTEIVVEVGYISRGFCPGKN